MKILGLDLGNRTLGMAISDYLEIIANPIGTFRFEEQDLGAALQETLRVIKENDVKKVLEEAMPIEVIMVDERLTSKIANSTMIFADISREKRKKNVDKLAASVILQSYLDRRK